jgi:RNA polymerase sigma factor (sigma-70 family)
MMDDRQLLARYVAEVSEEAFAELARRHTGLVYSAALRQVRNEQLAQDVTQVVFANLARRARSIPDGTVLAGWLHRDTRYTALDFLRAEARRLRREQESFAMNVPDSDPHQGWEEIRPLLDEALTKLSPADRDALLLRYFEQQDFAAVGATLGASADAARKRVERALERLREYLAKRGITTTAAALVGALTAHAVETVPAGLVVSLAAGAMVAGAGGWLSNLILMTKTKIAVGTLVLTGILATSLVLQQEALAVARAEQSALQARLSGLPASTIQKPGLASNAFDPAARDRADLERLRREAAALRPKVAEFSAQAQKLAAANPGHRAEATPLGQILRSRDSRDAGQATPAATLQTFLWAATHGETNRISQLFTTDPGTEPQKFQKFVDHLNKLPAAEEFDKLEMDILEEQPDTNNARWVLVQAKVDGTNQTLDRILLRSSANGWSMVVNTNGDGVEEMIRNQP